MNRKSDNRRQGVHSRTLSPAAIAVVILMIAGLLVYPATVLAQGDVDWEMINDNLADGDLLYDLPQGWRATDDTNRAFSVKVCWYFGCDDTCPSGARCYGVQSPQGNRFQIIVDGAVQSSATGPSRPTLDRARIEPQFVSSGEGRSYQAIQDPISGERMAEPEGDQSLAALYLSWAHDFGHDHYVNASIASDSLAAPQATAEEMAYLAQALEDQFAAIAVQQNLQRAVVDLIIPTIAGIVALAGSGAIAATSGALNLPFFNPPPGTNASAPGGAQSQFSARPAPPGPTRPGPQPQPSPPPVPYDGYQVDLDELKFQRDHLHHLIHDLDAYRKHFPPGAPGYDERTVADLRAYIDMAEHDVRTTEARIRDAGGYVPGDPGPRRTTDPYAGVGQDVAVDWDAINAKARTEAQMTHKIENFLRNHPEYGRLRHNLYDKNGYVREDVRDAMVEHFRLYGNRQGPSAETLNSDGYWFAQGMSATARELFTGVNPDGNTSWAAFGARTMMDLASGGMTESAFTIMNGMYGIHDAVMQGDSGVSAFGNSMMSAIFDEVIARGTASGMAWGADELTSHFPTLSENVSSLVDNAKARIFGAGDASLPLPDDLKVKQQQFEAALTGGNRDEILDLYRNQGIQDLGELEARGYISAEQAQQCNQVITETVEEAIGEGTQDAMTHFQATHDVKIKEVLVGDSGSSGHGAKPRSIMTDADRTTVVVFDEDTLRQYANQHGLTESQAYEQLSADFRATHQGAVRDQLQQATGLDLNDVDYGTYDRVYQNTAGTGGPQDLYGQGFTAARQSTQGSTTVYRVTGDGQIAQPYTTSGDALLDTNVGLQQTYGQSITDPTRISNQELGGILNQQKISSGAHTDVKSQAKALVRTTYVADRVRQPLPDPEFQAICQQIVKAPQETATILQNHGMDINTFVQKAQGLISGYNPTIPTT